MELGSTAGMPLSTYAANPGCAASRCNQASTAGSTGRAIGATDATGTAIVDPGWKRGRPIYVEDITSTIYSALGIDWTKALDNVLEGRRYYYVLGAAENTFGPVEEVFA